MAQTLGGHFQGQRSIYYVVKLAEAVYIKRRTGLRKKKKTGNKTAPETSHPIKFKNFSKCQLSQLFCSKSSLLVWFGTAQKKQKCRFTNTPVNALLIAADSSLFSPLNTPRVAS